MFSYPTVENQKQLAPDIHSALKSLFGFERFRDGQRDIAESIVNQKSVLAVMPTGAGKSLCYQLPACVLDGVTVVVSPLIALMKDQVDTLYSFGIPATCIHSLQPWQDQKLRLRGLSEGLYKIVYVAPERFKNEAFLETLKTLRVSLLAVDEAHCISQWGHDFRPDYRTLREVRTLLGDPVTIALTATATPEVREDILKQLGLYDARIVISGFERPNLYFEVQHVRSDQDKYTHLRLFMERFVDASVVVYCATRRQVEEVRTRIEHDGHIVGTYHGGLPEQKRRQTQDAFMAGDLPVLVATNAFGMGIDKSDVRAIVHFNMPGSLEAYYQEAGRAGRDGEPSHCLLFYCHDDRKVHDFFIETAFPPPEVVQRVWTELRGLGIGTHAVGASQLAESMRRVKKAVPIQEAAIESALRALKDVLHIDYGWRDGFPWVVIRDQSRAKDLRVDWDRLSVRRQLAQRQLREVGRLAEQQACRQYQLLRHFESVPSFGYSCNHCDVCLGAPPEMTHVQKRILTKDEPHILIRKILSGVARTKGRQTPQTISSMLRGSKAQHIRSAKLDELSTYGLLSSLKPSQVKELLRLTERHRLTLKSTRGYITLTDEGVEVMRGSRPLPQALDTQLSKRICIIAD